MNLCLNCLLVFTVWNFPPHHHLVFPCQRRLTAVGIFSIFRSHSFTYCTWAGWNLPVLCYLPVCIVKSLNALFPATFPPLLLYASWYDWNNLTVRFLCFFFIISHFTFSRCNASSFSFLPMKRNPLILYIHILRPCFLHFMNLVFLWVSRGKVLICEIIVL